MGRRSGTRVCSSTHETVWDCTSRPACCWPDASESCRLVSGTLWAACTSAECCGRWLHRKLCKHQRCQAVHWVTFCLIAVGLCLNTIFNYATNYCKSVFTNIIWLKNSHGSVVNALRLTLGPKFNSYCQSPIYVIIVSVSAFSQNCSQNRSLSACGEHDMKSFF